MRGGGFERLATEPEPWTFYDGLTEVKERMWIKMSDVLAVGLIDRSEERVKISKKKNTELILFTDILVASCFVSKKAPQQLYSQPMIISWIKETVTV